MGHSHSAGGHGGHAGGGHILPRGLYAGILLTLLVLTIVTVAVSRFDFGAWNLVVAMFVASIKATLVALFFMHLKYESPFTWIYAALPILFLLLLLGGVFIDNPYRTHVKDQPVVPAAVHAAAHH
jgi:cytochrome c oxidase subunit 4